MIIYTWKLWAMFQFGPQRVTETLILHEAQKKFIKISQKMSIEKNINIRV
jgi:hypothetical protein